MIRRIRLRLFGVRCRDVTAWLTDYLEGALDPATQAAVRRHFDGCDGCSFALDQFRRTIEVTGRLSTDEVMSMPADVRAELRRAFEAQGG